MRNPLRQCCPRPSRRSEERIFAALHAWTRETGEPPRSYEWSPATARSLGRYNDRAARWEREWPRWPGADTLRCRFGRFAQALVGAGLPARPPVFDLSLPKRVHAAKRLAAAGQPTAVIADHLGVHPATVRNYLRPVVQRLRHGCRLGRHALPALRARAAANPSLDARGDRRGGARLDRGDRRTPTASEWDHGERAAPNWLREPNRWPSVQVVRSRFGSWGAAMRAAGHRARWRTYMPDELIEALRREAARLGRPPTHWNVSWSSSLTGTPQTQT